MKHLNKSRAAVRSLSASTISNKLAKYDFSQVDRLLIEVYGFSGKPVTRNMLAERTSIRLTSVCARIRQLLDYELLDITGHVYCPVTGKLVTSLSCTPEGESLALCLLNGDKHQSGSGRQRMNPDKQRASGDKRINDTGKQSVGAAKRNVGLVKQYQNKKQAMDGIWL
ncbi:hypothetical protein [Oceanospirillum sediminis]|uniref:Uncharacterized protein n=1 Tax=Oceanospirillum sediminis TaxID=2760088 RepID=A0A839IMF4_9GAMM|nr:hypothetical protein [Oceanospirillum sediminis]MBB1485900.1 hypothetical protein [Oceanospirillum sediminis]